MKDNKLISMVDFVLDNQKNRKEDWRFKEGHYSECNTEMLSRIYNYANFLKQPLTLGMFVPCDEDRNVLSDPELTMSQENGAVYYGASDEEFEEYAKAEERVLFEGCYVGEDNEFHTLINSKRFAFHYVKEDKVFSPFITIEELTEFDLTLTSNALKQF